MTDDQKPFRILSLDGGGAKGFYSLGVLREVEGAAGKPLCEVFDLVFGTSTGSIIASLIALGKSIEEIHDLYCAHVPAIMKPKAAKAKTQALAALAETVYGELGFDAVKTGVGVVACRWQAETPMIFKANPDQAHGRNATFVPGFGVPIREAVQASCSAFPFFERKTVKTAAGDLVELVDGGYCANNPTLYAIADATAALGVPPDRLRVLSVGVGNYPAPKPPLLSKMHLAKYLLSVQLLQKTLEINTHSMEQLRAVLFKSIAAVRVDDTFAQPEMATDLFEHDMTKLNILRQQGAASYASREAEILRILKE
jgi:patatin-like phospholipase/acyl hydrolase